MSINHNLEVNQGETLNLHLLYTDANDVGIDLSSYSAELQVRRSSFSTDKILHLTNTGTTAGITAGSTGSSYGGMSGGLFLNKTIGNTGSLTGGILINAGYTATNFIPSGDHFYDLELKGPSGDINRILEGRFSCSKEITR
jgi:hypothetical protein|tara:strand:- start:823 stop:1245 length:423 start_codon:yes stop_codon:yes gene_type:complete